MERQDRSVRAFQLVGAGHFVECQMRKPVRPSMDLVDFRLLAESAAKRPGLRTWFPDRVDRLVNEPFGRFEVALQEITRRDQSLPVVVQVIHQAFAGKTLSGIEHRHIDLQQVVHRIAVFASIQPPEDRRRSSSVGS